MVNISSFGMMSGREAVLLTISNPLATAEFINCGAALRSLWITDKNGIKRDVCLGYDTVEEYARGDGCFGGTIGRCANRIEGARFSIKGENYILSANEGINQLHGGITGFHQKLWDYSTGEDSVTFYLTSPHGEEGFPGTLRTEVTYTLKGSVLIIEYSARCDRDTVVSLTNHSYFNLAGHESGDISGHHLMVASEYYTPCGPGNIPTGIIAPVDGTPLDLRSGAVLGDILGDRFLDVTQGLDHNYVIENGEKAAVLWCEESGIALELSTSMEGMQVYSAGFLTDRKGKAGARYGKWQGLCLETQRFPNAVNINAFPSPILAKDEEYRESTVFSFSVKNSPY